MDVPRSRGAPSPFLRPAGLVLFESFPFLRRGSDLFPPPRRAPLWRGVLGGVVARAPASPRPHPCALTARFSSAGARSRTGAWLGSSNKNNVHRNARLPAAARAVRVPGATPRPPRPLGDPCPEAPRGPLADGSLKFEKVTVVTFGYTSL